MRITVGCVDGQTYVGDYVPDAEVQAMLDEGSVFSGSASNLKVNTAEDFKDLIRDTALGVTVDGFKPNNIFIQINGAQRNFSPDKIVWVEVE